MDPWTASGVIFQANQSIPPSLNFRLPMLLQHFLPHNPSGLLSYTSKGHVSDPHIIVWITVLLYITFFSSIFSPPHMAFPSFLSLFLNLHLDLGTDHPRLLMLLHVFHFFLYFTFNLPNLPYLLNTVALLFSTLVFRFIYHMSYKLTHEDLELFLSIPQLSLYRLHAAIVLIPIYSLFIP